MEPEHRELIINKSEQLVKLINLDVLIPFVIVDNIFTVPMLEDIYDQKGDKLRKEKFLCELPTRGPLAFNKFVRALKATGHNQAAELLHRNTAGIPYSRKSINEDLSCANHNLNLYAVGTTDKQPLSGVYVDKSIQEPQSIDVYSIKSVPRGYCLIINNVDFNDLEQPRLGSDLDAVRLNIVFEYLGYHVLPHKRNLTAKEMKNELEIFSKKEEHKNVDSCIVIILTHGLQGVVMGTDREFIPDTDIFDMYDNVKCPSLKGKPKLFCIQACRGNNYDSGVTENESTDSVKAFLKNIDQLIETKNKRIPSTTDMFISYSTVEGYISIRNHYLGSWYCQALCSIFREHASKYDVYTMLGMVDKEVSSYVSKSGEKQATELKLKGWRGNFFYFNIP